jgi:Zn ribbon nucleic-acid-binding protein
LCALFLFLGGSSLSRSDAAPGALPSPTPPRNANAPKANTVTANAQAPANIAANTAVNKPSQEPNTNPTTAQNPNTGGKTIPKTFILGKDSLSEYGEAPFDHDTHAFKPYSPDGKSVVGCVECHHTDQPKSAMKPPLVTSERDVVMTFAVWQSGNFKVSGCRDCHFQDGNTPDGKVMPKATYTDTGKSVTKTLDNQLAYHINCNTCHDAAFKLRPELKKRPGFATTKDCAICHKTN